MGPMSIETLWDFYTGSYRDIYLKLVWHKTSIVQLSLRDELTRHVVYVDIISVKFSPCSHFVPNNTLVTKEEIGQDAVLK